MALRKLPLFAASLLLTACSSWKSEGAHAIPLSKDGSLDAGCIAWKRSAFTVNPALDSSTTVVTYSDLEADMMGACE
jgi:hypothetical protein